MTTNRTSANGKIPPTNGNSKLAATLAATSQFQFLKPIEFQKVSFWDTKRYFAEEIRSKYTVERLGKFIIEQREIVKPSQHPNETFAILGVSNKVGLFDAYEEKGSKIKQPYQKVEDGFLAYNPYRINVGSIGFKTDLQKNEYISNAYIVFSCKNVIEPEFLYRLFETNRFNQVIRNTTAGSVRQNLSFNLLQEMQIPVPPLETQKNLLAEYNSRLSQAEKFKTEAEKLKKKIENYLLEELGIKIQTFELKKGLQTANFKEIEKWGVSFLLNKTKIERTKFEVRKISQICKIGSGGTPSRRNSTYFNGEIPWITTTEVINDVILDTEQKISSVGLKNSSAKIYPKNSLIVAMYGQGATRGRTAKLGIDATTNQACAVLTEINNDLIETDFLWLYLQGEYERLRELASGNNQPNLNAQMIADYEVVIPPKRIQKKILKQINSLKAKIKKLKLDEENLRRQAKDDFESELFEL